MSGAFQTSREIFDNPIWKSIVDFRLFFLIYGQAVFSNEGVRLADDLVLQRGQWCRSLRNLQKDLEYVENRQVKTYSLSVLNRCISRAVASQRLCTKTHELGTVFTVLNYELYQGFGGYKKDNLEQDLEHSGNSGGTLGEHSGNNNKKVKKEMNDKKDIKGIKEHIPYEDIITYLNSILGSSFKHSTKATQNHIKARFAEKYTLEDFKTVIDKKCKEWINDPKMNQFLRPETLFGNKFESYLNQFTVIKGNSAVDKLKQMHMNAKAKEEDKREGIGSY